MAKCRPKLNALAILLVIASCFVVSHAEEVTCQIDPDCKPKKCDVGYAPICVQGICVCIKSKSLDGPIADCEKPEDCLPICGHPTRPDCSICTEGKCVCLC
ncbi:Myb-like domain-containing protein [Psidium guajava]|nr:Myb-like domain-containing protein [Psidium guajava]